MALIYANRISMGKFKYEDVPEKLKEEVKRILLEHGKGHHLPKEEQEPKEPIEPKEEEEL